MNQLEPKMEEFFEKAESTLKTVERASKTLTWIAGLTLMGILTFTVDTRIKVEQKADASEIIICQKSLDEKLLSIDNKYLTKKDALVINSLEQKYYESVIRGYIIPYPSIITDILNN